MLPTVSPPQTSYRRRPFFAVTALLLFLAFGLLAQEVAGQRASESWQLAPNPACATYDPVRCLEFATKFFPGTDRHTAEFPILVRQAARLVSLTRPGVLLVPDADLPPATSQLEVRRQLHHWLQRPPAEILTPLTSGRYMLDSGPSLRLMPGQAIDYQHSTDSPAATDGASGPPKFEAGLGPLHAGARGTHFEMRARQDGSTCINTFEGKVEVTLGKATLTLQAGESAYVSVNGLSTREIRQVRGKERDQCLMARSGEAVTGSRSLTQVAELMDSMTHDEADVAFATFADWFAHPIPQRKVCSADEAFKAARRFADREDADRYAPVALFLAWQYADSLTDREVVKEASELIRKRFPFSPWASEVSR